jgi:antitoxin YefM
MNTYVSISYARRNLSKLVSQANRHLDQVVITEKGQPKAILISIERLESLEETIEVLSIPGALESIKESQKQIRDGEFVRLSDLK